MIILVCTHSIQRCSYLDCLSFLLGGGQVDLQGLLDMGAAGVLYALKGLAGGVVIHCFRAVKIIWLPYFHTANLFIFYTRQFQ